MSTSHQPRSGCLIVLMWVIGCGSGGTESPGTPDAGASAAAPDAAAKAARPFGTPGGLPSTASVFDDTRIHAYEIKVDPADLAMLAKLAKNPMTEDTYVKATATVDGEDVGTVGLRYKGAYGTLLSCIDASFNITCSKMSFKVKFDEYELKKRYHDLDKVNLHSMIADATKMHEHLAYKLFRDMGLVAPRSAHATLTVNGEFKGLYAVTEAPDARFDEDRFGPGEKGTLYKEVWPTSTDPKYYQAHVETNSKSEQTHDAMIAFSSDVKGATTPDALAAVVDKWVGLDYMLRYTAVDRIISNWDGFTTFYCANGMPGSACGNHNLYWYVDTAGKRATLVVWDLDNTWQLITDHEVIMPIWSQTPANCQTRYQIWAGTYLMPPGCDPIFRGLQGAGAAAYQKALQQLLDGPFDVAKLQADIDRRAALIAPVVMKDPTLSAASWMGQVAKLKDDVALLREKLMLMRNGQDWSPFGLQLDGVNDFEGVTRLPFALGSSVDPNPATTANRALNQTAAITGMSDARADFVYRTDPKTAYTWLNFRMGLKKAPVDLTAYKQVRLRMKTDSNRIVRIDFDSPKYKMNTGARFGWGNLMVTPAGVQVTLDLDKITMPDWATNKNEVAADVRSAVTSMYVAVDAKGLNAMGFFPPGGSDTGFIQVDDIEFLK